MAHIFAFNDWSDRVADANSHLGDGADRIHELTANEKLWLALGLASAGLLLLALLSVRLLLLGSVILLLGVAYSFPVLRFKGKGIPLLSSMLHIAGTVLTFLLGYGLFSPIDWRALLIGAYFAMIITAGHLIQEIQDVDGDRATYISTNAVRFGPRSAFFASFSLFTLSFAYLFGLASTDLIPNPVKYLVVLFPVFSIFAWNTYRDGLTHAGVRRFRAQYRALFGFLVLFMTVVTVIQTLS